MKSGEVSSFNDRTCLITLRKEMTKLLRLFEEAGAIEIDVPYLLDPDILIDLYGEDIRNRAYTTTNSFGVKNILRPDFTLPILQRHIATEHKNAKYSYSGPVWRSQPHGSKNPSEYYQVGFEYFHEAESSKADAEVFELFQRGVKGIELDTEIGDMGIIRAIVNCLDISDNKRGLLLRHLWRPDRFRQLLKQLSLGDSRSETRTDLFLAIKNEKLEAYIQKNGPIIGKRTVDEILLRSKELLIEESKKPIPQVVVSMIEKIQSLKSSLCDAPKQISEYLSLGSELADVRDNLSSRIQSMSELGIDVSKLNFASNLTRTSLEYYDGFIFTSSIKGSPSLPPVVQGGRYNALTAIVGKGTSIPAVGGIIRPEILSFLKHGV